MSDGPLRKNPLRAVLAIASLAAILAAVAIVFFVAPEEKVMGPSQKIFYFHVAAAMNMMLAFAVCAVAGAINLGLRERRPDIVRVADAAGIGAAEVGLVLGAIVLVTGPIWARQAWGTWWTWEPRLTLSLLVFFLFLGYVSLRAYAGGDRFGRGLAAGLSLLGLPTLYFIHIAVAKWGGAHPQVVFQGGLSVPTMKLAFYMSLFAMFLTSLTLALLRAQIEMRRDEMDRLYLDADDRMREDET